MSRPRQSTCGFLLAIATALTAVAAVGPAQADSLARFSATFIDGSVTVVEGSLTAVEGSAMVAGAGVQLVVDSVQVTADGLIVVLEAGGEVSRVVLKATTDVLGASALAAGEVITVLLTSAGHVLHHAGRPIAFVPNELGRNLAHSSFHGAGQ
jgi:hypothetical protein